MRKRMEVEEKEENEEKEEDEEEEEEEDEEEKSNLDVVEVAVVGHAQLKLSKLDENSRARVCRDDPSAVDWLPVLRRIRYMLFRYIRVSWQKIQSSECIG